MSSSVAIQTALKAQCEAITLPAPFNTTAMAYLTEKAAMDALSRTENPDTPPFWILLRSQATQFVPTGGGYQITRTYFSRLYTSVIGDDNQTVVETKMQEAAGCIEAVEDYFMLHDSDDLDAVNVMGNVITRDSEAVEFNIENLKFAGVEFTHSITYTRYRS